MGSSVVSLTLIRLAVYFTALQVVIAQGEQRILAPPQQYALEGKNTTLNCSTNYPNAFITWLHEEDTNDAVQIGDGIIVDASLEDEGTYICRVHLPRLDRTYTRRVQLRVIIPPLIISQPPPYNPIMGNPSFNFTVQFISRLQENTTVTWQKDNLFLPEQRVKTSYTSEINGVTMVNFPTVSRSDAGLYQVTIKNVIPTTSMTAVGVYQLQVVVPPAIPSNVRVSNTTSSQVQVTWSLTHQHVDERAKSLMLMVQFSNGTIAQQYQLEGNATQQMVDTVPGMEYLVTVSASNQDGTRTTDPVPFQTHPGQPSISSVAVMRLNRTTFNLSVSLAYTGGGAITHFRISFRNTGTTSWHSLGKIPATPSPDCSLVWNGVMSRNEFDTSIPLTFNVLVVNTRGLSAEAQVNSLSERILAPPQQYALEGKNTTLNCSTNYPNAFITWLHEEDTNDAVQIGDGIIVDASLEDEGTYKCRVYLPCLNRTYTRRVQLRVIIPPLIISQPPPYNHIRGNPSFNFTVLFISRLQENTTVTWQKDNISLPEQRVKTSYTSEINGVTMVNFPTVSRSDAGLYQVTIKNVIPTTSMTAVGVYQLQVVVPPALPSNVRVSNTTSSQVQVTWSLTHQHVDERAKSLMLIVQFSNGTIAQQYQLEGNATQQMVDTVPGMEYRVTVSASNQDGTRTTDPVPFQTHPGPPTSTMDPHVGSSTDPSTPSPTPTTFSTGSTDIKDKSPQNAVAVTAASVGCAAAVLLLAIVVVLIICIAVVKSKKKKNVNSEKPHCSNIKEEEAIEMPEKSDAYEKPPQLPFQVD